MKTQHSKKYINIFFEEFPQNKKKSERLDPAHTQEVGITEGCTYNRNHWTMSRACLPCQWPNLLICKTYSQMGRSEVGICSDISMVGRITEDKISQLSKPWSHGRSPCYLLLSKHLQIESLFTDSGPHCDMHPQVGSFPEQWLKEQPGKEAVSALT